MAVHVQENCAEDRARTGAVNTHAPHHKHSSTPCARDRARTGAVNTHAPPHKHSSTRDPIPASTTLVAIFLTSCMVCTQPSLVSGRHLSPTPRNTQSTHLLLFTTVITTLSQHVRHVYGLSPQDQLIRDVMASNRSEEDKFQAVLRLQHHRYCEGSRTCLGLDLGNCGYCRPCQCDDQCLHYGDCCPDKLTDMVEVVPPVTIRLSCRHNLYGGYTQEQRQQRLMNSTSFLMTASCPPSAPLGLAKVCADPVHYMPVSLQVRGSTPEVDVFANKHCAQCHGVQLSSLVPWKVMLLCSDHRNVSSHTVTEIVEEAVTDTDCFLIHYPPPSLPAPRPCYFNDTMVTSCNVTGQWPQHDAFTERACASYLDPKAAEGQLFQNVFCYICNSADPQLFDFCERNAILAPMPFSALLDFSDLVYQRSAQERAATECGDSQIYDDKTGQCRRVLCAPRRHLMDEQCVLLYHSARGLRYALYFNVLLAQDLDLYDGNDLLHMLPGSLQYALIMRPLGEVNIRMVSFQVSFEITDEDGRCSQRSRLLSVFCTLKVVRDVAQLDLEHKLLNLRNSTFHLRLTADLSLNFTTQVNEHVWLTETQQSGPGRSCVTKVSNYHDLKDGDADASYTRVDHLLTLPKVALTKDEFQVQTSDLSLKVPWLEDTIPLDRYESGVDGNVYISLDDFLPKLKAYRSTVRETDELHVIISIVCTSLSLLGLAVTLLTYTLFKSLRTAPGKNNINLCLSLFLAQLFYLVGSGRTEVPGVCQAMGILIHYFWLSAFAAMSVCSYHMWRVFTSLKPADDEGEERRHFLQYTVYIWGSAAAVVVVTLLVHIIVSGGNDIGYGSGQCYLHHALGVLLAMGLPVVTTVTTSIVLFSLTVRTIRLSPKLTKSREDESHVWVYLKLSTLTGVTWALAFVVFFTEVTELRYVFTIVNGLQGLFIFLSFVWNRRVGRLYLACCRGTQPRFSSSTSSSCRTAHLSTISRQTETSFTDTTTVKA